MSDEQGPSEGPTPAPDEGTPSPAPAGVAPPEGRAARRRRPRRRGRVWRVVLVLALVVLVPLVVVGVWGWLQVDGLGGPGRAVKVVVPPGATIADIGTQLHEAHVVPSALGFRVYAKVTSAGPFQAGQYRMREDLGTPKAIDVLEAGPQQRYERLALPPGLTLDAIATRVGKLPGLSRERFLQVAQSGAVRSRYQPAGVTSLEGLTRPDTYYVSEGESEETVLRRIVDAFDRQADRLDLAAKAAQQGHSAYDAVIVASLIQGEAKLDEERPLIAAVVYNRLRDSMPLQIDATVLYARGPVTGPLTDADFARQSPWNTYTSAGLPPTPIMTVSEASLRAAVAPADVPYKYYVLTDTAGHHKFAVTYEEHLRNVADSRQRGLL